MRFSSNQTAGSRSSRSVIISMFSTCAGCSIRCVVSSISLLRSEKLFSGVFSREKLSNLRMMVAHRLVSRMTRSRSSASRLPSGMFFLTRWEKVSTPVSGLLSSCAIPAASKPTEASFSLRAVSAWALCSSCVASFTLFSSVRPQSSRSTCDLRNAPVMLLKEAANCPNSSVPRTGITCSRSPSASRAAPSSRSRSGR